MQYNATAASRRHPVALAASLGLFVSRAARAAMLLLTDLAETPGRIREIERLQALSDAQLARIGLRRGDIVQHVFRDRLA